MPQAETAWQFALDNLSRYFEHLLTQPIDYWPGRRAGHHRSMWELAESPLRPRAENSPAVSKAAGLLGQRTAEMHMALAAETDTPHFAPEPFT